MQRELKCYYKIFLEKKDDRVNTEIVKRYQLRDSILSKAKELHKQLMEFINSILNSTLDMDKYARIQMLMDRQRVFQQETIRLNQVELSYTRTLADLQRNLLQLEVNGQRKLNNLRLEMEYFQQVRKNIENCIENDSQISFQKMLTLTGKSYEVISVSMGFYVFAFCV